MQTKIISKTGDIAINDDHAPQITFGESIPKQKNSVTAPRHLNTAPNEKLITRSSLYGSMVNHLHYDYLNHQKIKEISYKGISVGGVHGNGFSATFQIDQHNMVYLLHEGEKFYRLTLELKKIIYHNVHGSLQGFLY